LKPLDRHRAAEAASVAANSRFVAERIERTWERGARVIYPPVDVDRFSAVHALYGDDLRVVDSLPREYLLGFSRFVPYKQLEAAILAGRAANMPVVIAGGGPDESRLRAIAEEIHPRRVTFVVDPSPSLLTHLYRLASALIFAPVEDFGIVPVEAMATGTAVVGNYRGGVAESVVEGRTGTLVEDWESVRELRQAVERAMACSSDDVRDGAQSFGVPRFRAEVQAWLGEGGL